MMLPFEVIVNICAYSLVEPGLLCKELRALRGEDPKPWPGTCLHIRLRLSARQHFSVRDPQTLRVWQRLVSYEIPVKISIALGKDLPSYDHWLHTVMPPLTRCLVTIRDILHGSRCGPVVVRFLNGDGRVVPFTEILMDYPCCRYHFHMYSRSTYGCNWYLMQFFRLWLSRLQR